MTRILNVARMQWINRATFVTTPLIVLGGAFLISLLIYAAVPSEGPIYGGGAQAPLWYFLAVGIQSLTLTFPFSQAMSTTRRDFFFGSVLAAGATALPLSVVFVVGGLVEKATGGWWMNGWIFHLPWMWSDGILGAWLLYFALPMLFFMVGFAVATVYKRFGMVALTTSLVGLGVAVVLGVALITWLEAWRQVWRWIAGTTVLGLGGYLLLGTVALGALSLLMIRRAVP